MMTPEFVLPIAQAAAVAADQVVPFFSTKGVSALATLAMLEIVLGIDNVVFIAILTDKLPEKDQKKARMLGLTLAGAMRLVLLALASWIMQLKEPFAEMFGVEFSGQSVVLLVGGLFLIAKATWEIHHHMEGASQEHSTKARAVSTLGAILLQILMVDLVFSIDSVVTAVGMTDNYAIMATAVILSVLVMLFFAGPIGRFVNTRPTMKTLAFAFLVLIGVLLVAEGLGEHFNRGYVYFAMGFAIAVEMINLKAGARRATRNAKPEPNS
ncbi:MAG: putative tellurium resistance membrane protein TerC [Phycisphaerales bacterium]|jgi:predicted tellurium resistance membrane protein TerC